MQTDKNIKESQIADLQKNIKSQQEETSKAKKELKGGFKNERANWESEKAALLKREEDAEVALKPVAEELTRLKHQVNAMTSAIFGKYLLPRLCECLALKFFRFNMKFLNYCR